PLPFGRLRSVGLPSGSQAVATWPWWLRCRRCELRRGRTARLRDLVRGKNDEATASSGDAGECRRGGGGAARGGTGCRGGRGERVGNLHGRGGGPGCQFVGPGDRGARPGGAEQRRERRGEAGIVRLGGQLRGRWGLPGQSGSCPRVRG